MFATGSFWFSSLAMAAGLATLAELEKKEVIPHIQRVGARLVQELQAQVFIWQRVSGVVWKSITSLVFDFELVWGRRRRRGWRCE